MEPVMQVVFGDKTYAGLFELFAEAVDGRMKKDFLDNDLSHQAFVHHTFGDQPGGNVGLGHALIFIGLVHIPRADDLLDV